MVNPSLAQGSDHHFSFQLKDICAGRPPSPSRHEDRQTLFSICYDVLAELTCSHRQRPLQEAHLLPSMPAEGFTEGS